MTIQTLVDEAASGGCTTQMLMKAAGGTVTVFAFGPGGGLAEHATPREALVTVLEGALDVTLGGETRTVRAGECVRFPAGEPHAVHAPDGAQMLLVQLHT